MIYKVIKLHLAAAKREQAGPQAHETAKDIVRKARSVNGPLHTVTVFSLLAVIKAYFVLVVQYAQVSMVA